MNTLHTLLGITLLYLIHPTYSQLFEYDCTSVNETVGVYFYVDEVTPFGVVFSPLIDGKFNRLSLVKTSTDMNGTAFLFESVVLSPDAQEPLASVEFYSASDTDLLSISFDSLDVTAGSIYTLFITVDNTSFATFYEGQATNSSGPTVYMGSVQPYSAAYDICIRYTVALNQYLSSDDKLSKADIATIVAAVGVPVGSLLVASFVVLLKHGLTSKDSDEEEGKAKSKQTDPQFPTFPKTTKSELKRIKSEDEAPSSNEGSDNEQKIDEGESSNDE
mmetsp:Transcript_17913/g.24959  ORF Transcript_17913/g.24959 Transcript_17913/m.24959 type:complete len:275 (+) Transcript_17913:238-1062(+)